MNPPSTLFAVVTTFAAAAAFATTGEATYDYPQPIVSATSRADVKADAWAARAAGRIVSGEASSTAAPAPALRQAPQPRVSVVADALPLNVEALSFDGRAARAPDPAVAAVAARSR